ncbi:MAG TPA: RNA polymerase sigma factor [Niastella sp.]
MSFNKQQPKQIILELTANIIRDELVERCKRGDPQSFQQLYRQYSKAMYNTSLRIVNNTADAEDVLQESFLDAFRSLHDFHYRSTFGAWLKKIVINKSINILRKRRNDFVDMESTELQAVTDDEPANEEEMQYKVEEVKRMITRLPDGYRTVLSLYLLEGYDHEEISQILNISHNTVRTQYVRAKQKLLTIIKQGV